MAIKVYLGMSGGVDSSVSAYLLKKAGYDVTGVYMKNWSQDLPGFKCPWREDYLDAKRVAVQLGIPFKVYDFQKEYRKQVVDYMIKAYQQGLTPNPDIRCNQDIKFKLFFETALKDGADLIATGHYAQIENKELKMAKDLNKDQTYFLYRISQESLAKTLFPVGKYLKPEIRAIALKNQLKTAQKKDSQGICFIGEVGIKEFLVYELGEQPKGPVIDQNGREVGVHDGAIFYTIGQRHGLNIGGGLPYYVIKKDLSKNIVYVSSNIADPNLWSKKIILREFYFTNTNKDYLTKELKVRVRYRGELIKTAISFKKETVELDLETPVKALAPGQSAVLYCQSFCIGGGIIV